MIKIWTSEEKGNDKIIAVFDNYIYKSNPRTEDMDEYVKALQMRDIPAKNTLGIPFHYIKEICHQEGKDYLQVFFGKDSEEHLRITSEEKLKEIFSFLSGILPQSATFTDKYTPLRSAKKPLIALGVVSVLFLYALETANDFGSGVFIIGGGERSISLTGIDGLISALGVKNVVLLFIPLMGIAIIAFARKFRRPPVFQRIIIRR